MQSKRKNFDPSVYFIADPSLCAGRPVEQVVAPALRGGVTLVQFRDKELSFSSETLPETTEDTGDTIQIVSPAQKPQALQNAGNTKTPSNTQNLQTPNRYTSQSLPSDLYYVKLIQKEIQRHREESGRHVPLIINDHVDLAVAINADGVHLGQGDMDPQEARQLLGPDKIIGMTAFTEEQIRRIDPEIVDYIGLGPFFETKTKKGKPILGQAGAKKFTALAKLSPIPVVGIGGVTSENAAAVIEAGADGVAMMRSISEAPDPQIAAQEISETVKATKNQSDVI